MGDHLSHKNLLCLVNQLPGQQVNDKHLHFKEIKTSFFNSFFPLSVTEISYK